MSESRYFQYCLAQYVHWRREERLNVGLVAFDPNTRWVVTRMDTGDATRRVKAAFPDVDRVGLNLALEEVERSLANDQRLRDAIQEGEPYRFLSEWQNMIRFTPPKIFPAKTLQGAVGRLVEIYVDDPSKSAERPSRASLMWAKKRTAEAIYKILNPIDELQLRRDVVVPSGNGDGLPIRFPFLVLGTSAIDTLAFESDREERSVALASNFIRKVRDLKRSPSSGEILPYATVALSEKHADRGRKLIEVVRAQTGLSPTEIVEADHAEVLMEQIKLNAA